MTLPYDMGNAGDLLKHGALAEFVRWHCGSHPDAPFRFVDPFGGLPWSEGVCEETKRRVRALSGTALGDAQNKIRDGRYYGSGWVVRRAAEAAGKSTEVRFSDRDPEKRKTLSREEGFVEFTAKGFDPRDGYSVLNSINQKFADADLVLIDPFSDFLLCHQDGVTPRIAEVAERVAVVLFVLNKTPGNPIGKKWRRTKKKFLSNAWTLSCPRLSHSEIRGETDYDVEVVIAAPCLKNADDDRVRQFNARLQHLAGAVCRAVKPVRLNPEL